MMDFEEEENDVSDLEELEFALYSQIHYQSSNLDPTEIQTNLSEKPQSIPNVHEQYDIDVICVNNGESKCSSPKTCSSGKKQSSGVFEKSRKFNSASTLHEDSAIGLESFLSLDGLGKSVMIECDSLECSEEENSKAAEVLSKERNSRVQADSKKSVIEIESDSEDSVILLSDHVTVNSDTENVSVNSDDMLLDEELSDLEGLHVNVEREHQSKLSMKYDFAQHQKTWHIIDADRYGTVPHHAKGRYYGSEFETCQNCKQNGHLARSCSKPKLKICILCGFIGHLHWTCHQRGCFRCGCPGHMTRDCTEPSFSKWHPCFRCGMQGHNKKTCPEQWRQYHLTTDSDSLRKGKKKKNRKKHCYNCAEKGHYGFECEEERMENHCFPSYPFISSYDFPGVNVSNKRGRDQDFEEQYQQRAKKSKPGNQECTPQDSSNKGKKKKSQKLKRIYDRLETEKELSKRKKKKMENSNTFGKQSYALTKLCSIKQTSNDCKGFDGNTVTQKKTKKNKKLKRIYDRIDTEKQQRFNGTMKRKAGKEEARNCNPNWQKMKKQVKGSTGPSQNIRKNGKAHWKSREPVNPMNSSKGFKTKLPVKK